MPISASQIAAAAARLEELDKLERFDGAVPGSRPNAFQQAIIDDWGKYPTQAVTAGNQSIPGWAPVTMADGSTKEIREVRVGDQVLCFEYSKKCLVPVRVERVWNHGKKEVFRYWVNNFEYADRTDYHEMVIPKGKSFTKVEAKDARRFLKAVREPFPIQVKEQPVDKRIELLGFLLGDGCLSYCVGHDDRNRTRLQFTNTNPTIIEYVRSLLLPGYKLAKYCDNGDHFICKMDRGSTQNTYMEWIRHIGLAGALAGNKFVPACVYEANTHTKVKFLAGLISTDGWCTPTGIGICTTSKELATGIHRLFLGLGLISTVSTNRRETPQHAALHSVEVRHRKSVELFKSWTDIAGKPWRLAEVAKRKSVITQTVKRVESLGVHGIYDIEVDHPDHNYVCDGFVTGNSGKSSLGARLAAWFLAENKPGWVRPASWGTAPLMGLIIGRTMSQVENELLRKIQAFFEEDELRVVRVGNAAQSVIHKGTGNKLLLASHHNEREAREKVQSFVLNFEWLDEMPRSVKLFEELERRVQSRDGWFISTFTPKVKSIDIRKLIESYAPPFSKSYKMPMFANPILSEERKEKILQELEAYPEEYRRCILEGDWLTDDQAVYQIDPDRMVKKAPGYHYGWRHVESADPATNSKHGQVVFAEDPNTRFWYIKKADYITGIRIPSELIKTAANKVSHLNVVRRVCDPASTWYIYEASGMGFTYMTPWGKTNGTRREEMMKNLQERLGVDLFIDPECEDLIEELSSMEWSETQAAKVVNSRSYHLHDATIYGLDCLPPPEKTPVVMDYWARIHAAKEAQIKAKEAANKKRINRMKYRW